VRFPTEIQLRRSVCAGNAPARRCHAPQAVRHGGSLHRSRKHRVQYSRHACEVARDHRQLEVLVVDPLDAAIHRLPDPAPTVLPRPKCSSIRLRMTWLCGIPRAAMYGHRSRCRPGGRHCVRHARSRFAPGNRLRSHACRTPCRHRLSWRECPVRSQAVAAHWPARQSHLHGLPRHRPPANEGTTREYEESTS
jgi:hypothetical protein